LHLEHIAIVFNPKGGTASKSKVDELAGHLHLRGVRVTYLATTAQPGSAMNLARDAANQGVDLVVAFGGDGTACQVAEGLIGTTVPMAVFPGGTGNLFARSFYSNPTTQQFAEMLLSGKPQAVDMIEAEYQDQKGATQRRLFMVGFGIGKVSDAISTASPAFKRIFGRLVYVVKVALACLIPNSRKYELNALGDPITETVAALFAINVAPPMMANLSRGCNASDGLMDVIIFRAKSAWQLIGVACWLALGRPERSRHYRRLRTSEITIRCAKTMLPNIDGDPGVPTQNITLRVKPGAARMVVS
jgi:diacylglycerol kinase (ATP)